MSVHITLDPKSKFKNVPVPHLAEACGLLHVWLVNDPHPSLKERLISNYPYYTGPMSGGVLRADGTYLYPGDPVLFPLAQFETESESCFVFEYGIVGVFNKLTEETWVTRMD